MADKYPKNNLMAGISRAEKTNALDTAPENNGVKTKTKREKKEVIKTGRPELPVEEKLSRKVTLNFTETEYQKLLSISKQNYGVPLGKMLKQYISDSGFIK